MFKKQSVYMTTKRQILAKKRKNVKNTSQKSRFFYKIEMFWVGNDF